MKMNALSLFRITVLAFFSVCIGHGQCGNLASALSLSATARAGCNNQNLNQKYKYKPAVVVGKIIIDEYGDPFPSSSNKNSNKDNNNNEDDDKQQEQEALPISVSIGGGGPQAAFGAAAALAVWDSYHNNGESCKEVNGNSSVVTSYLSQPLVLPPVLLVAPVGKDWTASETSALLSTLNVTNFGSNSIAPFYFTAVEDDIDINNIVTYLLQSDDDDDSSVTPRIRMWHDQDQVVHWYAINDSFGPRGADSLWRNRPSAEDLVSILRAKNENRQLIDKDNNNSIDSDNSNDGIILHIIAEAGKDAAGGQLDSLPLFTDPTLLRNHFSFVGIEPVASGESIEEKDALSAATILRACWEGRNSLDSIFWCPDQPLDEAMRKHNLYDIFYDDGRNEDKENEGNPSLTIATRDGPRGSQIWRPPRANGMNISIPAAALSTEDGDPIDPTGAGNAYAAAMTTLIGNGVPLEKAACIATGVGAVVCEHEGLPTAMKNATWSSIVDRIHEAAMEVGAILEEKY